MQRNLGDLGDRRHLQVDKLALFLVPGRRGMTYTEEDWIDDEATSHRRPDE